MELAGILFQQTIIMFLYMAVGVFLFKKKIVTKSGSGEIAKMLVSVIMPLVIVKAYMVEFTREKFIGLVISFGAAVAALFLSILVSRLCFKKHPVEHFGCSFSNAGFMGIPLIQAVFGGEAVFYISAFVALLNVLQWTYGVYALTEDKKVISPKAIFTNPVMVGFYIGLILFFLPIQLPAILVTAISGVAGLNGPVAMIVLGVYLAQLPIKEMVKGKQVYIGAAVRLILIPLLTMLLLSLLPNQYLTIKMAIMIVAAAPIGSNVAIFAQLYDKNYTQAVKDVCFSTICCIVTIPLVVGLANILWS